MRRHRRLEVVLRTYRNNVERHQRRFRMVTAATDPRDRDAGVALAAIDVLNTWSNFARAYWFSAFGTPRTTLGRSITSSRPLVASDPLGFAVLTFRPNAQPNSYGRWDTRSEPTWHDPQTLLRLTSEAGLSCFADVAAAFSVNSRVFYDLPVLRNYFAHRNQETYYAALRVAPLNSVPTPKRPSEILTSVPATSTQSLFLNWLGDFDLVADYCCA